MYSFIKEKGSSIQSVVTVVVICENLPSAGIIFWQDLIDNSELIKTSHKGWSGLGQLYWFADLSAMRTTGPFCDLCGSEGFLKYHGKGALTQELWSHLARFLNQFQGVLKIVNNKMLEMKPTGEYNVYLYCRLRDVSWWRKGLWIRSPGNCHYQFAPHPESQLFAKFLARNMQTGIWRKLQNWRIFGAISNFL